MTDLYNMSFLDNSTNLVEIISGIGNVLPNGSVYLIGDLFLLSFFLIFLILAMRHNFNEVLIIDGFITTLLAILFYSAGMVSVTIIAYPVVIFVIALIFYLFSNG